MNIKYPIIKHLLTALFAALVSFMILVLLHPFGMDRLPDGLVMNSLVTAVIILVLVFALNCLNDFLLGDRISRPTIWSAALYAVIISILIGSAIYVFQSCRWDLSFSWQMLGTDILCSFIMTGIVFTIVALTEHNITLKGELDEERKLNSIIQKRLEETKVSESPSQSPVLTIDSALSHKQLQMQQCDFLYATSQGNYIDINFLKDGQQQRENLRLTMKELEIQLQSYDDITRCHRAFIVNIDRIESAQGNSQGYTLTLRGTTETVPVSRHYVELIKQTISSHLDS